MKKIFLKGTNMGTLGSFELPVNRLTVLTAGTGLGKSLLSRALAFMANAGALLDETVTFHLIGEHFDLVENVIHRIDESSLTEDEKNALLDRLEEEGLHEDNIPLYAEKGFVTKEEEKRWEALLSEDWTELGGKDTELSRVATEAVKDAVLANFPGLFHDGYEGKGEHSLVLRNILEEEDAEVSVTFDGEGRLTGARLPFTRNAVYLSEEPLCAAPYPDEDDFPYDYESVRDRMYFSIVNHADADSELSDGERSFRKKLTAITDRLLSDTIEGQVDYDPEEMEFTYTRDADKAKYYLEDMSRGMQVIADIALMVKKGQINPDSMIVLDSIDSAFDGEWRTALAEWISSVLRLGPRVFVTTRTDFADVIAEELIGTKRDDVTWLFGEGTPMRSSFYDALDAEEEKEEFLEELGDQGLDS